MKTFETVGELPKRDTETWSEQMFLKKMALIELLNTELPQTFHL